MSILSAYSVFTNVF